MRRHKSPTAFEIYKTKQTSPLRLIMQEPNPINQSLLLIERLPHENQGVPETETKNENIVINKTQRRTFHSHYLV